MKSIKNCKIEKAKKNCKIENVKMQKCEKYETEATIQSKCLNQKNVFQLVDNKCAMTIVVFQLDSAHMDCHGSVEACLGLHFIFGVHGMCS